MPGYEQYLRMSKELPSAIRMGNLSVAWKDGGKAFEYTKDGKTWRFDIATKAATELQGAEAAPAAPGGRGGLGGAPERGRQVASAASPDKTLLAVYRNRNIYITDAAGANEVAVTTDGSEQDRIKYGTASWVYGEELAQTTAMWWSPDGRKLAYYRFDESQVPDYYLQLDQTKLYSRMDIEAYPKSGKPNPLVDLFVYDVAAKTSVRIDVRDGRPFENDVVGHYAYRVSWSPDGRELLFTRANRRQNILEFTAANPDTGVCRTIVREEWPTGWVETSPTQVFLKDGRRFIWASERTGWRNYYLYDLSGTLVTPLTRYTTFEAAGLIKIDEDAKAVFLMARDGDNFLKQQLHRVGLDGKSDVRLTDPAFHHTVGSCMPGGGGRGGGAPGGPGGAGACGISPDNKHAVVVYQTHATPPSTRLIDGVSGKVVAELAASDLTKFNELGLRKAEMFTYLAADGKTHAARHDQLSVELRSGEEVPGAGVGVRRPGLGGHERDLHAAQPARRVRVPRPVARLARRAGHGQADARRGLRKAGPGRDGRHGGGRAVALEPALRRPRPRGHLRHVVRRLLGGHVPAAPSRRVPRGVGLLGRDGVGALRHDLHRALHVDPAGEPGGLRRR